MKQHSVFYPPHLGEVVSTNAARYPWAAQFQEQIIEAAQPWLRFSDDELWAAMFGHTITRAWMVWSNGHCPACKREVPMYSWTVDAFEHPWKVGCPHCRELFPKNDFHRFYCSGLDEHGVFAPDRADRTLLFNPEHPAPDDPLHLFGVDDGEGYVEGERRWRFIGAYLIYGQWKQLVHGGIKKLGAAHVVTGDPVYAHKAGVLLDRVADLYPTFDGETEIRVYEKGHGPGYVSTWHDACIETRELALAYDQIFAALREDGELVAFLNRKARQFGLDNPKATFADVQRNIEDRILIDARDNARALRAQHRAKIMCNFPQTDVALALIEMVLGWPENRAEVLAMLDPVIEQATAIDGVTGEKGLTGYATFTIHGLALFLEECARVDEGILTDLLMRHPKLRQTYRFHIDTWCLQQYYPLVGDCGGFGVGYDQYQGLRFQRPGVAANDPAAKFDPGLPVSMYSLLWRLYKLTGDAAFVQVMYRANDDRVDGLPYDLFAGDPAAMQREVAQLIAREGPVPGVGSVNKQQWHLAILRSGQGEEARAAWLHYDCRRGHGHADGMNLGLFAKGLDLMPDFGYPPVQYGGWDSPKARWYKMTAAHNTVVVDGQNQAVADGVTTLWAEGEQFRAIRLSGSGLIGGKQFERTVAMVDISGRDFYVMDVFRVVGGTDHAKFTHSQFGQITTEGLSLRPAEDYGHDTQMRNFRGDPAPQPGWSADWRLTDDNRGADIHLRYTDLTFRAQASVAEAWTSASGFTSNLEVWIPCVMVRRQSQESPLASTFAAVIEPYERTSNIAQIRRLSLETPEGAACPEPNVAVEVGLIDGQGDLFVARDVEDPLGLGLPRSEYSIIVQREWGLHLDGEMCLVRRNSAGEVRRIAVGRGRSVRIGEVALELKQTTEFIEVRFEQGRAAVVAGRPEDIRQLLIEGERIQ